MRNAPKPRALSLGVATVIASVAIGFGAFIAFRHFSVTRKVFAPDGATTQGAPARAVADVARAKVSSVQGSPTRQYALPPIGVMEYDTVASEFAPEELGMLFQGAVLSSTTLDGDSLPGAGSIQELARLVGLTVSAATSGNYQAYEDLLVREFGIAPNPVYVNFPDAKLRAGDFIRQRIARTKFALAGLRVIPKYVDGRPFLYDKDAYTYKGGAGPRSAITGPDANTATLTEYEVVVPAYLYTDDTKEPFHGLISVTYVWSKSNKKWIVNMSYTYNLPVGMPHKGGGILP